MPNQIHDEFTALPISREMRRQLRCMALGVCVQCGVKAATRRCDKCKAKDLKRHKERYAAKRKVAA